MNCSRAALPASSPEMGCPMFAQFFRANVGPRAILREFPCSPRRCLPAVAGPSAAEPAEEGGTPLCPSHKAARNPVLSLLFSINYNGTYNLLKTGTIKTFVFTLMRTLSPQVPCYEQTNKNIPGVWVPPPVDISSRPCASLADWIGSIPDTVAWRQRAPRHSLPERFIASLATAAPRAE